MPEFKGKFTDLFLKALKAEISKKPPIHEYDLREGHGFGIRVRKSGVITFFYMYHFNGKRRFLNLGTYGTAPDTPLTDARQKHAEAYSKVKTGIDPLAAPAPPERIDETLTVSEVANEFLERWSKAHYSEKWHYNVKLALESDVLPKIGDRNITTIRRREIISLLEGVVARAPGQARNVHKSLSKMFWYAQDREYIDTSPCTSMLDSLPSLRVSEGKNRTLDDKEIIKLFRRLDCGPGHDSVKRALKVILITAQRPEEVAEMHSDEISREGEDYWWTIPWQRIKTENSKLLKRPPENHRVYLSPLAMSIIGNRKGFIFPTASGNGPIRRNSLSQRVDRGISIIRHKGKRQHNFKYYGLAKWSPHDLRRTARTGMAKIEIPKDWAEEVLNHKDNRLRSIYDQHKYDVQKKKALNLWSEHLYNLLK